MIFNIAVIALTLLIAYWWSNQGLFSALLHALAVVVAGAVALSVWEPLTYMIIEDGGGFDDYAAGTVLVGTFVILLSVLRFGIGRAVPGNVDMPDAANMLGGGALGLVSGTISVGILIIGAGHIQASDTLFGWSGYQRSDDGTFETQESLWYPAHKLTTNFYEYLSVGAFDNHTGKSLRNERPDLYRQATLIRDPVRTPKGRLRGKVSIPPDSVKVRGMYERDNGAGYAVLLSVDEGAFDNGSDLRITSAAMRLIGNPTGDEKPASVHPDHWYYPDPATGVVDRSFASIDLVASETAIMAWIEFPALPGGQKPKYLEIKGARFTLPAQRTQLSLQAWSDYRKFRDPSQLEPAIVIPPDLPYILPEDIRVSAEIKPIILSKNAIPGGMDADIDEGVLTDGEMTWRKGSGENPPRSLRIDGIKETDGHRIVRISAGNGTIANVIGPSARLAGRTNNGNVHLQLIDEFGRAHRAIGYMFFKQDNSVEVKLDRRNRIQYNDLPFISPENEEKLEILFSVRVGLSIQGFAIGDTPTVRIGNFQVTSG